MASFGQLLKQLRIDAGLTQEELAESAGISPRSVSDLERGVNLTARKDTARLLAKALHLEGAERAAFEAAARGRLAGVASASRTLPRDINSFTGREVEISQIGAGHRTNGASIYAIGGMAGVGKTAFAVHVAHRLADQFPDGQVFLPLHAHSPGQLPVDTADALESLLRTIGVPAQQIPAALEERTWMWRDQLADRRLLLVLDDAVDSEQVRPLLPDAPGTLVLITSQRHLTALDDANAISLDALSPSDAADLLVKLAARPGLDASDAAIDEIGELCGYLPLALGMIARRLHHHPAWTAADMAADLAEARDRLALMHTEDLSVVAAFERSYQDLAEEQRLMFRLLGVHPGTDVDAFAAAALWQVSLDESRQALEYLYDRYLIMEPARHRFRLHDLIREFARDLATDMQPVERIAASDRILDYYLHTARVANTKLGRRVPDVTVAAPAHVPEIPHRDEAIAWLDAERLNLHATAEFAASSGRPGHATAIPAAMHEFLRSQGHWQQAMTLDQLAIEAARHASGQIAEARALTDLADMLYLTDDYEAAAANLSQALGIYRRLGNRLGEANVLTELGAVQQSAGSSAAALESLSEALELYRALGDRLGEANALTGLGVAQQATGSSSTATHTLSEALELYRALGDRLGEANALTDAATVHCLREEHELAAVNLARALELYGDLGDRSGEARALNTLGEVTLARAALDDARAYHDRALAIAMSIVAPREEARALEGLGRCLLGIGQRDQAVELLHRSLSIYRQIGSPSAEKVESLLISSDVKMHVMNPKSSRYASGARPPH